MPSSTSSTTIACTSSTSLTSTLGCLEIPHGDALPRTPTLPMAVLTNKPVNPLPRDLRPLRPQPHSSSRTTAATASTQRSLTLTACCTLDRRSFIDLTGQPHRCLQDTVMIGDSDVDILTARNCGAISVGCAFGLSHRIRLRPLHRPTYLVDRPRSSGRLSSASDVIPLTCQAFYLRSLTKHKAATRTRLDTFIYNSSSTSRTQ